MPHCWMEIAGVAIIVLLCYPPSCLGGTISLESACDDANPVSVEECCDLPFVSPSQTTIEYDVVETGDVTKPWQVDALITWSPPPNSSIVDYRYSVDFGPAVSLSDLEGRVSSTFSAWDSCRFPNGFNPHNRFTCSDQPIFQTVVDEPRVVFRDLLFGFMYRVRIQVIADDLVSSENICFIDCVAVRFPCPDTITPDCLEATGDEEFCRDQPVIVASIPRNLTAVEAVNSEGADVLRISWVEPLLVNQYGRVIHYEVGVCEVGVCKVNKDANEIREMVNPCPFPEPCSIDISIDDDTGPMFASKVSHGSAYEIRVAAAVDLSSYREGTRARGNLAILVKNISSIATTTGPTSRAAVNTGPTRRSTDASSEDFPVVQVAVASGAGIFVAAILFVLVVICLVRMGKSSEPTFVAQAPAHTQKTVAVRPEFANKELFDENIVLEGDPIGSGQYGRVYVGFMIPDKVQDDTVKVAVKTTKEGLSSALKEEFLDEIRLMLEIGEHPNIMAVLGCRTVEEPYYLVIEYMAYGSLKDYLMKCQKPEFVSVDSNFDLTERRKVQIVQQITAGMTYLSTTRYFHGDLAARNVLINQEMVVKISDFGLAIDIYQRQYSRLPPESKRPVKWYSPEANIHGRCSTKGDVWSFGIVLYEIYTYGGDPYPGMRPRDVIYRVNDGYRMGKPDGCPDKMYELMTSCWRYEAPSRPPFAEIKKTVEGFIANWEDFTQPAKNDNSHSYENVLDPDRSSIASFTSDASLAGEGAELKPDLS